MLYIRKAEASEVVGHERQTNRGSIRMLTILFILGIREGSRKSQKPREVKIEAAVETARDLRGSES